jgi:hypothetical protein
MSFEQGKPEIRGLALTLEAQLGGLDLDRHRARGRNKRWGEESKEGSNTGNCVRLGCDSKLDVREGYQVQTGRNTSGV